MRVIKMLTLVLSAFAFIMGIVTLILMSKEEEY